MTDPWKKIRQKTEEAAAAGGSGGDTKEWAEAGDTVCGRLAEVESDVGKYGSKLYLIEVKDEDDSISHVQIWGSTVLDRKFQKKKVAIGDYVGITFLGWQKGLTGTRFRDFDVQVIKEATNGAPAPSDDDIPVPGDDNVPAPNDDDVPF